MAMVRARNGALLQVDSWTGRPGDGQVGGYQSDSRWLEFIAWMDECFLDGAKHFGLTEHEALDNLALLVTRLREARARKDFGSGGDGVPRRPR
jgi:hypothetical protein